MEFDKAAQIYRDERIEHWDKVAAQRSHKIPWGSSSYLKCLKKVYKFLVPKGLRVLEIGCADGELLASLEPAYGVGVDLSAEMVELANEKHPELTFVQVDAHDLGKIDGPFDIIILSDTVNELWNVQVVLEQIKPLTVRHTRIIINFYSRLWEIPLDLARSLKLAHPTLQQNWLTTDDVENLLHLAGFELLRQWQEIIIPIQVPLLSGLFNKVLVRLWPFRLMALSNFVIAHPQLIPDIEDPSVSVVVPARNEEGNIAEIFERVPNMGSETELIFVEGHSQDNTYEEIEKAIQNNPQRKASLYRQSGIGKADAVRLGYDNASGDILLILDADLTVAPEDLPRFYDAMINGKGEFINGVRLVYPMQENAMRSLNLIGNKFFSLAFSWLLDQKIKDTLCGTKVLWHSDYNRIKANRAYFGEFDPFGDFDLIFGAAKLNLKIIDMPIRYRERTYGSTNISRWKHGVLLLRMVLFAATRLKFL